MPDAPKVSVQVKLLRESGMGPILANGGPFRGPQSFEWQLVDATGTAVGGLSGEATAAEINRLAELRQLLRESNALAQLKARFDFGYYDIPVDMYRRIEKLLGS